MKIKIVARPNLHNKYGFSLVVDSIMAMGEGSLKRAFELTRSKLAAEGLFASSRKRQLPVYPEIIGLITSRDAAAYSDIIKLLNDRWPLAEVLFVDSRVQGDSAPDSIIKALGSVNRASKIADLVIIARGGGSLEDLAAFNDERVVRAIVASRVPTVVGVGHERDLTLADLAADVRATTPTNAAQISTPDRGLILDRLNSLPRQMIETAKGNINILDDKLYRALKQMKAAMDHISRWLENTNRSLIALSPSTLLLKGYVLVRDEVGNLIISAQSIKAGDIINTKFHDGEVKSEVINGKKG